jgi:hypothetical protein
MLSDDIKESKINILYNPNDIKSLGIIALKSPYGYDRIKYGLRLIYQYYGDIIDDNYLVDDVCIMIKNVWNVVLLKNYYFIHGKAWCEEKYNNEIYKTNFIINSCRTISELYKSQNKNYLVFYVLILCIMMLREYPKIAFEKLDIYLIENEMYDSLVLTRICIFELYKNYILETRKLEQQDYTISFMKKIFYDDFMDDFTLYHKNINSDVFILLTRY